jgi:hypothetical protein
MAATFEPYLSHYTDRAGLEGIAKSKSLWATRFLDLTDTREYLYAWSILTRDAMEMAIARVPLDYRRRDFNLDKEAPIYADRLRTMFAGSDGYNNLYVTSFARARDPDEDERGVLGLWREYAAKHEGYCLQFRRKQIQQMIDLEAMRANYSAGGVVDVIYGIDKTTAEYEQLRYQMAQSALLQMLQARPDMGVEIDVDNMWPMSHLAVVLSTFCAKHKDPCFKDEREVRVFVYPSDRADSRVFTGMALRKKIRTSPRNRKYLALGEGWRPGLEPVRIIVGEKAMPDSDRIAAMFEWPPRVALANLPVA